MTACGEEELADGHASTRERSRVTTTENHRGAKGKTGKGQKTNEEGCQNILESTEGQRLLQKSSQTC